MFIMGLSSKISKSSPNIEGSLELHGSAILKSVAQSTDEGMFLTLVSIRIVHGEINGSQVKYGLII